MIRSILIASALAACLMSGAPPVRADNDLRSTISVAGEGRVTVEPDIAELTIGVEATAPTVAAAQADASARMRTVIDTMAGMSVARADMRTARLSISPVYDQRDASRLRGYQVSNVVRAKLRDLNAIGPIVDAVSAAGANRVDGISFDVEDLTPVKNQARALALANARQKADQLAALSGVRIVGVKSIVESDAGVSPVRFERATALAAPAAGGPPPIEPGTQEVRTHLAVTYLVE
jgi:hypothetical protein